ncbi:MAG: hypothetical protein UX21_C0007G0035 [Microgenomates group bacterium GW2011_GWC2_45_8]|nr:MAG: hypothetical protein UX21_C0007G0035 [Microgenomates group bacterium GW2011_GWC2_45_8]
MMIGIIDWIYPRICVGCGREEEYICKDCQKKLAKPEGICPMCCKPSLDGWTHARCRNRAGMERLIVGLPYRGLVQDCLKKVKYKSAWEIVSFLFGLVKWEMGEGIITSVPMWREKERGRGFNQAKILAELMGNNVDLLERVRETKAQYGLNKEERAENIKNSFRVISNNQISKRLILVDDVWTTGSTMRECTKVLKRVGAGEVWGLTLAR